MSDSKERFEKAFSLVLKVGKLLKKAFYNEKADPSFKEEGELVTNFDIMVDAFLKEALLKKFPDSWISEESKSVQGTSGYCWILDPIDGTNNFFAKIPFFCISLSLVKDDKPKVGIIYDPVHDFAYTAFKDDAFKIHKKQKSKIEISDYKLNESVLSLGISKKYQKDWEKLKETWTPLRMKARTVRRYGSAALEIVQVALGQLGVYCIMGYRLWDVSAAIFFALNAGAKVIESKERNFLMVYNPSLEKEGEFSAFENQVKQEFFL